MFRKYFVVLIVILIIALMSCSRCESENTVAKVDEPYLSERADALNVVVVAAEDNMDEEIKAINQRITEMQGFLKAIVYDAGSEEGNQIIKQYKVQNYPAYLLFNDHQFVGEKADLDQATAEVLNYRDEFYMSQSNMVNEMTAKEEGTYSIYVFWEGGKSEYQSFMNDILGVIHSDELLRKMSLSNLTFVNLGNHAGPYDYKKLLELKDTPVIVLLDTSQVVLRTTRPADIVDYFNKL